MVASRPLKKLDIVRIKVVFIIVILFFVLTTSCFSILYAMCLFGSVSALLLFGPIANALGIGVAKGIVILAPVVLGIAIIGTIHFTSSSFPLHVRRTIIGIDLVWAITMVTLSVMATFSEGYGQHLLSLYSRRSEDVIRVAELVPYDFKLFQRVGLPKKYGDELTQAYVKALSFAFCNAAPEKMQIGQGESFDVLPTQLPICCALGSIGPGAMSAVPELITYLEKVQGHEYYTAEFDNARGTVQFKGNKHRRPEDAALSSLRKITGEDFGTDVGKWIEWWKNRQIETKDNSNK